MVAKSLKQPSTNLKSTFLTSQKFEFLNFMENIKTCILFFGKSHFLENRTFGVHIVLDFGLFIFSTVWGHTLGSFFLGLPKQYSTSGPNAKIKAS